MSSAILEPEAPTTAEPVSAHATRLDRGVQARWVSTSLRGRLRILRAARHELASQTRALVDAISPDLARTPGDTRVAEVLPLLAACKFLVQEAGTILAPRRLGRSGLPFWLSGVSSEVHRVPFGHVLVVGPANYPLFLPGVQALQALAAGNAVTWKPGRGGEPVARIFARALHRAGLPDGLLTITDDSVEAAKAALNAGPDKVFFTGSAQAGRQILRQLAETATPSVMELSGSDAVIVLPSADLTRVVKALTFGLRLNGSATCMAPRRVLLVDATQSRREDFLDQLQTALGDVPPVTVPPQVRTQLRTLLPDAETEGATVHGDVDAMSLRPILVTEARPEMRLLQADLFAPILSVLDVSGGGGIQAAQQACPFALTASIFGEEQEARRLASTLTAGTVLINDLIVPTADPRVPFGGRRASGFGVTRGAEGLLEMTAVKVVSTRRDRSIRHYEATTAAHEPLFDGIIAASHARTWRDRLAGWKQMALTGKNLSSKH